MLSIVLNIQGRRVLVVGAGPVGQRKVHSLLRHGASVIWVAPDARYVAEAPPAEPNLAQTDDARGELELRRREYQASDVDGCDPVFAATDDRQLNAQIAADARRSGAWVNAADQPDDCDFYMPAVHEAGRVSVAVSTQGAAPGLAAMIRDELANALPQDLPAFADALATLRDELRPMLDETSKRGAIMKQLSSREGLELFGRGSVDALRRQMHNLVSEHRPTRPQG